MIYFLRGKIENLYQDALIIDVDGIGYKVLISKIYYEKLLNTSEDDYHKILTYHHITESNQVLFGFIDKNEKSIFRLLISVSGIGPKIAMQLLSSASAEELENMIVEGDVSLLTELPGIGSKTAKRLIVELKDKFTSTDINLIPGYKNTEESTVYKDAFDALLVLGYSKKEIRNHILSLLKNENEIKTPDLITKVLKKIGR